MSQFFYILKKNIAVYKQFSQQIKYLVIFKEKKQQNQQLKIIKIIQIKNSIIIQKNKNQRLTQNSMNSQLNKQELKYLGNHFSYQVENLDNMVRFMQTFSDCQSSKKIKECIKTIKENNQYLVEIFYSHHKQQNIVKTAQKIKQLMQKKQKLGKGFIQYISSQQYQNSEDYNLYGTNPNDLNQSTVSTVDSLQLQKSISHKQLRQYLNLLQQYQGQILNIEIDLVEQNTNQKQKKNHQKKQQKNLYKQKIQDNKKLKEQIKQIQQKKFQYIKSFKSGLFQQYYQTLTTIQILLSQFNQFNDNIKVNWQFFDKDNSELKSSIKFLKQVEKNVLTKNFKKKSAQAQKQKPKLIAIKEIQKIKYDYILNPEFKNKLKFIIGTIYDQSYYVYNKVTQILSRKKIQDQSNIQGLQKSLIQLNVNIYGLSYLVYYCLNKFQNKKNSQQQEITQLAEQLVQNIFEKPRQQLYQYNLKKKKAEQQVKKNKQKQIKKDGQKENKQEKENKQKENKQKENKQKEEIQEVFQLEYQAKNILIRFTQQLCKRILQVNENHNYQRKIVGQTFLLDFLEHLFLYNYVINCYQFNHRIQLDLFKYHRLLLNKKYCKLIKEDEVSYSELKMQIFWDTFIGNQKDLLAIIFLQSLSDQQNSGEKQNHKQKNIIQDEKVINFTILYQDVYRIPREQKMIDLETKYIVHFQQYAHELIQELSESKNISLEVTFNSIRFFEINMVLHFTNHCLTQIIRSIEKSCGRLHKNLLIKQKTNNSKWNDCQQRSNSAISLAFQKLLKYMELMRDPNEVKKSSNVQKMKKIVEQQKDLIGFLLALNIKRQINTKKQSLQNIQEIKKILHIFKNNQIVDQKLKKQFERYTQSLNQQLNYQNCKTQQDYQNVSSRPKIILKFIIDVISRQYLSLKTFQKTWKKLLKKHIDQQAVKTYEFKQNFHDLQAIYKAQKKRKKDFKVQKFNQFQRDYLIAIIESLKFYSIIVTIPFFSFETQRQNQRIRYGRQKDPNLRRREPKTLKQILKTLDLFYIYKAQRLNTFYLQKCKIQDLHQIKMKYIRYTKQVSSYFQYNKQTQNNPIGKLRMLQSQISKLQNPSYNYTNKPILTVEHYDQSYQDQNIQLKMNDLDLNNFRNYENDNKSSYYQSTNQNTNSLQNSSLGSILHQFRKKQFNLISYTKLRDMSFSNSIQIDQKDKSSFVNISYLQIPIKKIRQINLDYMTIFNKSMSQEFYKIIKDSLRENGFHICYLKPQWLDKFSKINVTQNLER